jgi:uncharacterized protein (TIGR03435 family)
MKLTPAITLVVPIAVWIGQAFGQSGFQVASIKPNGSGDPGSSWSMSPGETVMHNITLKQFIGIAYDVRDYSLSGPAWISTERFDMNARTPAEVTAAKDSVRRAHLFQAAMQALLADRFKLVVHRETRNMPAYALVVAKGGLKIAPDESEGGSTTTDKNGKLTATRISMARMAGWLANDMSYPVTDKTEIAGVFSFRLEYTPERNLSATGPGENAHSSDSSAPSIFTALQEQLGLKLEPQKLPVDIIVVDNVARVPTEN